MMTALSQSAASGDDAGTGQEAETLPAHLIQLPESVWMLWRCAGLRSAGFPIAQVLPLADAACAAAADRLLDAEAVFVQAQHQALAALRDSSARQPEEQRRAMRKLYQRVHKAQPVESVDGSDAVVAYQNALNQRQSLRSAFERAHHAATARISQVIAAIAGDPRFQEAIAWQNRPALHNSVLPLLQPQTGARDSQRRKREALVARYWQRYCTKNDTIGFFGPVGWAWWTTNGPAITAVPATELLEARQVYFEGWAIDALAEHLSAQATLRPWMPPRALPFLSLDGCTVRLPEQRRLVLSEAEALVLRRCDGTQPARALAADLVEAHRACFADELAVFAVLERLVAAGLIRWAFEVPLDSHPERRLCSLLQRIDEPDLAGPALSMLDELEDARAQVAQAAGDATQLAQAIGRLEATFTRLTGTPAGRLAGQMYAARTLVYEDCRRRIDLQLGPQVLQDLSDALDLLLTSARWCTWQAAGTYRRVFQDIYAALVNETGNHTIDFATFWQRAQSTLFSDVVQDESGYVEALAREHRARWMSLLELPEGERRVHFSSAALREQVYATFAAPGPGWQAARYHSPDVMIAAPSVDAIRRGDYQCVLGELHIAVNTLRTTCFVNQHPQPSALIAALDRDMPAPRVVLIEDKEWPEFSERSRIALIAPKDLRLAFAANTSEIAGPQIVTVGELVIAEADGELVVRSRDGQRCFDVIELFSDTLSILIASAWTIRPSGAYTPRITIDNLVVARETWQFDQQALAFAFEKDEQACFLGARRWAQAHTLPRHVFVRVSGERKPVYVDFNSPILVDNCARLIRTAAETSADNLHMTVTEMLPDHDQTWLPDAANRRYACELRLIAVDRAG